MSASAKNDKMIKLEINAEDLLPHQVRLIKSMNAMLVQVLNAEDEEKYFEGSAELMRLSAAIIKEAQFTERLMIKDNIPYAEQALEYSMDVLSDYVSKARVVNYDN